jgi:hypothetical protein
MFKFATLLLIAGILCLGVGCDTVQPDDGQTPLQEHSNNNGKDIVGKKLYVIVHKDNPQTTISKHTLKNIYLGTQSRWSNEVNIERYDYPPAQQVFYEKVLAMPMLEVSRYWLEQKIKVNYQPPIVVKHLKELMQVLQREPGAVAYVPTKNLPQHVKIVAEFDIAK